MRFIDTAKIYVASGKGGDGCMSFAHEKFKEFAGPDGGDGGNGGDVFIRGDIRLNTLLDLRIHPHQKAGKGQMGQGSQKTGKSGKHKVISVPLGTVILEDETNDVLFEVMEEKTILLLKGGKGGKGNYRFKTSTNRAPRHAQSGQLGEEMWIRLELKLIADVGLVGLPNAGKSTLISTISRAKPKIAAYPFTTLVPNLGVVKVDGFESFVVADVPGIIKNAHKGVGLGFQFLRHLERTSMLVFLIECTDFCEENPFDTYQMLYRELEEFSPKLVEKKRIVALSKIDTPLEKWNLQEIKSQFSSNGIEIITISSVTREGLEKLLQMCSKLVQEIRLSKSDID